MPSPMHPLSSTGSDSILLAWDAKEALQTLGVPPETLDAAHRDGDIVDLWCTLEQLGGICGRAGLHYFLTRPHHQLAWQSPVEPSYGRCVAVRNTVMLELAADRRSHWNAPDSDELALLSHCCGRAYAPGADPPHGWHGRVAKSDKQSTHREDLRPERNDHGTPLLREFIDDQALHE